MQKIQLLLCARLLLCGRNFLGTEGAVRGTNPAANPFLSKLAQEWWLSGVSPRCAQNDYRPARPIDASAIADFVSSLNVSEAVKAELRAITPHSYVGVFDASEFAP